MSASKIITRWILQLVLSITVIHILEVTACNNTASGSHEKGLSISCCFSKECTNPLIYGIICFLAVLVFILLILLFKVFSANIRVTTHENRESTPVSQNHNVHPPLVNDEDDSSSTSSESHEGSLADVSSRSHQGPCKMSDYINLAEGQINFMNDKTCKDVDYVNVNKSQNKICKTNCDDGTSSISSETSAESTLKYSKVVFTKAHQTNM